jgi:hypothetical protein
MSFQRLVHLIDTLHEIYPYKTVDCILWQQYGVDVLSYWVMRQFKTVRG